MTSAFPRALAAKATSDAIKRIRDRARGSGRRPLACRLAPVRQAPILSAQVPSIDAPAHVWDSWLAEVEAAVRRERARRDPGNA